MRYHPEIKQGLNMLLHQESENRQDIIAIRYFAKDISESLSNLLITAYNHFDILSIYSDLTKNLLAYKVLNKSDLGTDSWVNSGMNKTVFMDFNPVFNFVPGKFATAAYDNNSSEEEIKIMYDKIPGQVHYSEGLLKYHQALRDDAVYLYQNGDNYSIFIFRGKDCVFANSFTCGNAHEVLYFILNALQINEIDPLMLVLRADFSVLESSQLLEFFTPYFKQVAALRLDHPEIDNMIPELHEMLFANHLLSLCV